MRQSTKIKIAISGLMLVLVMIFGYFYIPGIFGDSVYPLKYADLIVKYSAENKLDPSLTAAVIMQESGFNPSATSYMGARGIMQIMPATAKSIAKGLGVTSYDLYNPDDSIRFGTWHLHVMIEKYNGNVNAGLAAYNAGGGNADYWVAMGLLDNIPFKETRNYVKNINNYQKIYQAQYANELSLYQSEYAELEQISVNVETEKPYGTFWKMFFKSLFKY